MKLVSTILLSAITLITLPSQARLVAEVTAENGAEIASRNRCASGMGSGGNYVSGDTRLSGKCQGAGIAPEIKESYQGEKYLNFKTDSAIESEKDRTELAITSENLKFLETHYIGLRLMIPSGVSETDAFFYLLQLWQCSPASPIGGIRVARGQSHEINFLARSDDGDTTAMKMKLQPDQWYGIVLRYQADPSGYGSLKLWADGREISEWKGPIGFKAQDKCDKGGIPPQHFRVKFGIYKGNEPGRKFEANFDDVRVGQDFHQVKPW